MAAIGYGWEGVTAGALPPTTFWDSVTEATGGTLRGFASAAYHGTMGGRCLTAASNAFAYASKAITPVSSVSFSIIYRQPATNPSGTQQRVVTIRDSAGADILRLDQHTDGTMLVRNSSGTSISACNPALGGAPAAGTPVMWQVYLEPTGGYLHTTFTNLTTSAVIKDSGNLTGQAVTGNGSVGSFHVGWTIGSKTNVTEFQFDDVSYDPAPSARYALIDAYTPVTTPPDPVVDNGLRYMVDLRSSIVTGAPSYTCTDADGLTVVEPIDGLFLVTPDSVSHDLTFRVTDDGGSTDELVTVVGATSVSGIRRRYYDGTSLS